MNCWYCGSHMYWNSDFNYDEVFGEGEGVISYLICSECGATAITCSESGATAQFSLIIDEEDEM